MLLTMPHAAIRHVHQPDNHSCVVACLAMVTGLSFAAVRRELGRHVCPSCGVTDKVFYAFLANHGYAVQRIARKNAYRTGKRHPWPPVPFADVHVASVKTTGYQKAAHAVVWFRDGRVFDPELRAPVTIEIYAKVIDVVGIHRVNRP